MSTGLTLVLIDSLLILSFIIPVTVLLTLDRLGVIDKIKAKFERS